MAMPVLRECQLSTRDIVDRVVLFCEALSDIRYYTYQSLFARRIVESILNHDGADITGLWSRQCGKTETVATVGIGVAVLLPVLAREFPDDGRFKSFAKGIRIGIYAPIQNQSQFAFDRMRDKVHSDKGTAILSDPEIGVEVLVSRGDKLVFSNGSIIVAKSASPDTKIEGDTHHVIFLEECQKILRSKVEKDIEPMRASTNGTMVKIGTAWESRGGFHHSIQHNVEMHKKGALRNHFQFPYDIVISEKRRAFEADKNPAHLDYEKYVKSQIMKLGGVDSDEFKMNFRCLWLESRVIAIREDVFDAAANKKLQAGPSRHGFQVAGLDIGKLIDSTVLTVMRVHHDRPIRNIYTLPDAEEEKQVYYPKSILDWLELGGSFEGHSGQYQRLIEYLLLTNVQVLCIDSTSMGDPVFERIEHMIGGTIMCVPFRFGGVSKSELYKYYLQEFNAGRIDYAADLETQERYEFLKFRSEHLDLDKVDRGSYAVCQAPEGGHDDYPDSGALACWAEKVAEEVIMPDVQVTSASELQLGGGAGRRGRTMEATDEIEQSTDHVTGAKSILEMMAKSPGGGSRANRYSGRR